MATRELVTDAERVPLLASPESNSQPSTRVRCYGGRCWLYVAGLLLITLVLTASLGLHSSSPTCPKKFPPNGPGIGIALSTDYNTIAVRQDDGQVKPIARIQAPKEYTDLLKRLSLPSSKHPTPPYHSMAEMASDRPRQWRRTLRKKAGYPASSDVAIIAQALKELIVAAENSLPPSQLPLTSALVALPNAMALYPEDAQDALEYLGLQALRGHAVYTVLRALPAAYAGYGIGLCAYPEDFDACLDEEQDMPNRGVVAIDITSASLGVDARRMDTPMYVFDEDESVLNWDARFPGDKESEVYWEQVRNDILRVVDGLVRRTDSRLHTKKFVDDVLWIWEARDEGRLRAIVREVVAAVQEEKATIRCENPEYVVAYGATELAKRLLLQRGRIL
jgi:hypothetical protein